ncbi:MAG: PDZ domain-containing protein [Verrucomicrobia bacterium]|nr:PDZ domain-containing protein [Verrucomicrobiota bacterium]
MAGLLLLTGFEIGAAPGPTGVEAPDHSIHAGILRYPAVSETQIAFTYAGDIWVVPKEGGTATRLSSPPGEESFPRFSPDGSRLAFSGHYDGNLDIYVMPVSGGLPTRVTHHGASDRVVSWYPDGQHLLFASGMASPRNRFNQLFKVPATGGLPERLPIPYGEFGDIAPDGRTLAYIPVSVDFRTWKRYRGGMNPDIWLFDLQTFAATNLTHDAAADAAPMWHDRRLYFLSDRDGNHRANLWVYEDGQTRQVTHFKDYDVHFPSIGPSDIVFENAGRLYRLELQTEACREVPVRVVTDQATLKSRVQNVSEFIHASSVSPAGKRALVQARGEIFSLPAEHGPIRNLTRSAAVAERYPAWSPDARWIACFSDRSGEYELVRRPAEGEGEEETLTALGPGYRYRPQWSPDSRKILFIDQAMKIWLHDLEARTTTLVDRQLWRYHPELERFRVSWSADSRWIAYSKDLPNRQTAIALYDCETGVSHPVTSGFYEDDQPAFDPGGQYLFYRTGRDFKPIYSDLDNTWIYANTHRLAAVPLRVDVPSPLAPRNDAETVGTDQDQERKNGVKEDKDGAKDEKEEGIDKEKEKEKEKEKPKAVKIDLEGFETRAVLLPPKAGQYDDLQSAPGKLVYRRLPRTGEDSEQKAVEYYDLQERETKRILDDADSIELSADRKKLLVRREKEFAIVELKADQKMDKKLATGRLETTVDPPAEWRQIFTDAWRLQRDYFYDPGLHGVDWLSMRERYQAMLADAATRWDVNYVLGELIGELNASHTYRQGGDVEKPPERGVGYLGCDFALTNGAYQIQRILRGAAWDAEERSPLLEPGLTNVQEGSYLLAVNGEPIDTSRDPWAAFQGTEERTITLTVNSQPTLDGAREVLVQTLKSEERLRYLDWVEQNRRHVDQASGGRIAYVYVPDTGPGGQTELVRQYRGQTDREGLIVDERFNSGGQIPDRFVELLDRPIRNYWGVRDGADWPWPPASIDGPRAMLINGWSGSGGDCFPYYFQQSRLGPLIGTRTWGGLIGMTGSPPLVDNGYVTVPVFGIFSREGEWIIEGYGVDPDIEVIDDPARMARGEDPQLERAIAEVLNQLESHPKRPARKPEYPNRSGHP